MTRDGVRRVVRRNAVGSWLGGALVVSGFGLGTLQVMLGLGLALLRRRATTG